jgi:xanthine dehydrogenase YagR molybdenum-binding subunit
MRGPGAVPGLFATESAMDELAIKLNMDPVEFRLLNEPQKDESNGLPFSSRHFQECLRVGAEEIWLVKTKTGSGFDAGGRPRIGLGSGCMLVDSGTLSL